MKLHCLYKNLIIIIIQTNKIERSVTVPNENTRILVIKMYSGSFVKIYGKYYAAEKFNLEENNGKYYGIINGWKNPSNGCYHLNNVDISKIDPFYENKDKIENVLVVYVEETTSPNVKIVAFAKNSIIYRKPQSGKNLNRFIENVNTGEPDVIDYHIVTNKDDMLKIETNNYEIDFKKYPSLHYMFRNQKAYLDNPSDRSKLEAYQSLKREIIHYYNTIYGNLEDEITEEQYNSINEKEAKEYKEDAHRNLKYNTILKGTIISKIPACSKKALVLNEYKCSYDETHTTFITAQNNPYMEGHHLIRCTKEIAEDFYNRFQINIDISNNIVCLCPNCHRKVHYGNRETKKEILTKLYEKQKEKLEEVGIKITLDELFTIYNVKKKEELL